MPFKSLESQRAWARGYRERNREKIREYHRQYEAEHPRPKRVHNKAYHQAYYQQHREKRLEYARTDRHRNPERTKSTYGPKRRSHLRRYGLTADMYDAILAQQGGRCALCRTEKCGTKWKYFDVDHDHKTKVVRGLLCRQCNVMLGQIEKVLHSEHLTKGLRQYLGVHLEYQPKLSY